MHTQVMPYLRQLRSDAIDVSLLTFEPQLTERWSAQELKDEKARLAEKGIDWHYLQYHKRPTLPATLYDIAVGARRASKLIRERNISVLHARGHVPALIGALAKRGNSAVKMIFDIRGFMPEEYTDAGLWREKGVLYRGVKRVERYLFNSSDAFVVLTEKAREILFPGRQDTDERGRPFEVIPCCVDFERYAVADSIDREELRRELNFTGRRVIVYVGSFGGWYMTEEMTRFLALAHQEDSSTYSLILTQSDSAMVASRLQRLGIRVKDIFVGRVSPEDVPRYLRAADLAISFIKPCYSKLSSSPTKIAEYLAAGLPIITNAGVGDVDALIEGDSVGVVLRDFSDESFRRALQAVEALGSTGGLKERCRASAEKRFDLEGVGGAKYRRLYQRLLNLE